MQRPTANIDRVFKALGDPTRRAILERLSEEPISVSQLAEPLEISLPAVMQHLQILEDSGLVHTEKIGRTRTCQLEPNGLSAAEQWLAQRRLLWQRRLDRLAHMFLEDE